MSKAATAFEIVEYLPLLPTVRAPEGALVLLAASARAAKLTMVPRANMIAVLLIVVLLSSLLDGNFGRMGLWKSVEPAPMGI